MLCDEAVRHFVENNRGEQEQTRGNASDPMLARRPVRMLLGILIHDIPGEQREDDEPRGVHVDGDAGDGDNAESWTSGHHGLSGRRSSYF